MPQTTFEREVILANANGLHARPATQLVELAQKYQAEVTISKEGFEVSGKSIMGVLMLAAECGSKLLVRATGPDAGEAIDALAELITGKFGEEE